MLRERTVLTFFAVVLTATVMPACAAPDPLADGQVSDAELLAAADQAAQCVTDAGWEVDGPRLGAGGVGYVLGVWTPAPPTDTESAEIAQVVEECWSEHVGDLEQTYYAGLVLEGPERQARYLEMIDCLEAAGVHGITPQDPESVVGEAVGTNDQAIMCLQAALIPLFGTTVEVTPPPSVGQGHPIP